MMELNIINDEEKVMNYSWRMRQILFSIPEAHCGFAALHSKQI